MIAALEATYAAAQLKHPDLPNVVFITGTGLTARGAKWGHYGAARWVEGSAAAPTTNRIPEIFIAGERLACGAAETLQTLLHEAVHALATVRNIKEVSRDNRYHNMKFVALSEELGLEWPAGKKPHTQIGFSAVVLAEDTATEYTAELAALDAAIVAHLDTFKGMSTGTGTDGEGDTDTTGEPSAQAPKSKRNNDKATCCCETPRIIRASATVLAGAAITCGDCNEAFMLRDA
jgi:hypothetical protein